MPLGGGLIAGSIAAPILGGIIGNAVAGGDQDKAEAARLAALQAYAGITPPSIGEQQVQLQQEKVAGQINPAMEGTVQQGPSAMANISTDPRLAQAQMAALQQMQGLGTTGLTAADRMALLQINQQANGNAQAAQGAIMQNLAARGMGGGGAELAARMMAAQNGANQGAMAGQSLASQAQQKALAAMSGAGQLGAQMQSTQFGQQAAQAQAADAIARFNAANKQQVMGTNTGATNSAQYANLANQQAVANANTGIANTQEEKNKALYQQQYGNQLAKASGMAGQENNVGNYYGQQAQNTRGMYSGIGQGVGSGLAAAGAYAAKQPAGGSTGNQATEDFLNSDNTSSFKLPE